MSSSDRKRRRLMQEDKENNDIKGSKVERTESVFHDDDDDDDHHVIIVCSTTSSAVGSLGALPDGVLLTILSFIVSPDGKVDGNSLRALSQVSSEWHRRTNDRLLWDAVWEGRLNLGYATDVDSSECWFSEMIGYTKVRQLSNEEMHDFPNDDDGDENDDDGNAEEQEGPNQQQEPCRASGNKSCWLIQHRATKELFMLRVAPFRHKQNWIFLREARDAHRLVMISRSQHDFDFLLMPLCMDLAPGGFVLRWYHSVTAKVDGRLNKCTPRNVKNVARGLAFLHSSFVTHGYVHPSNIYVESEEGKETRCRLSLPSYDPAFDAERWSYTSNTRISTRLDGGLDVPDRRDDVWSFGCLLAKSLTSKDMFKGASAVEVLTSVRETVGDEDGSNESESFDQFHQKLLSLAGDGDEKKCLSSSDGRATVDLLHSIFKQPKTMKAATQIIQHPWFGDNDDERLYSNKSDYVRQVQCCVCPPVSPVLVMDPAAWATVADWAIEVVLVFDLDTSIAHLAMMLFERFLLRDIATGGSNVGIQTVVAACLYIASRLDGPVSDRLSTEDLAMAVDNTITQQQLEETAQFVVVTLQWKVGFSTLCNLKSASLALLKEVGVLSMSGQTNLIRDLLDYLTDLALMCRWARQVDEHQSSFKVYPQVDLSVVLFALAIYMLYDNGTISNDELEQLTPLFEGIAVLLDATTDCEDRMHWLTTKLNDMVNNYPTVRMVQREYRKPSRSSVSTCQIPILNRGDLKRKLHLVWPSESSGSSSSEQS